MKLPSLPVLLLFLLVGCSRYPDTVPVSGKILYNGEPLKFGSVMFQPRQGQPARAQIQPDGTFALGTYKKEDGAVLGEHRVRVMCYTSQNPNAPTAGTVGEQSLGTPLIPLKYSRLGTSGLTAEVTTELEEPLVFELVGPRRK